MDNQPDSPSRPWREIAEQASKEANSERLLQLAAELVEALDKEGTPKKLQKAQIKST